MGAQPQEWRLPEATFKEWQIEVAGDVYPSTRPWETAL